MYDVNKYITNLRLQTTDPEGYLGGLEQLTRLVAGRSDVEPGAARDADPRSSSGASRSPSAAFRPHSPS